MTKTEHEILLIAASPSSSIVGAGDAVAVASEVTAQRVLECACRLGEGIVYDDRTSSILWTDIYGKRLHRLRIVKEDLLLNDVVRDATATGTATHDVGASILEATTRLEAIHAVYEVPKQLCSFCSLDLQEQQPFEGQETQQGIGSQSVSPSFCLPLLCAWEDGFSLFDVAAGKELGSASRGPDVRPNRGATRLNDGRVDPFGTRFVCGGFYGDTEGYHEKVFSVGWDYHHPLEDGTAQLAHEAIVDRIQTTNSIAWTLDGRRMYLADSAAKTIWTHEYDPEAPSPLSDRRVLCSYSGEEGFVPDGSCVDAEGYLWNAVWCHGEHSGKVHRIHPGTGQVVLTVRMPDLVSQVSCCCFGGRNLDILFITTAREGRDPMTQPHAGDLFAAKIPGVRGRLESRFKVLRGFDGSSST
jgi:L-arabinonolactonase